MRKLKDGVWLVTARKAKDAQKNWPYWYPQKNFDFSLYPMWIIGDFGAAPVGIACDDDLDKYMEGIK